MRLNLNGTALLLAVLAASSACAMPAPRSSLPPPCAGQRTIRCRTVVRIDLRLLSFRWGPRRRQGAAAHELAPRRRLSPKPHQERQEGAMPAFGTAFTDAQIDEIIKYIRSLKPREG